MVVVVIIIIIKYFDFNDDFLNRPCRPRPLLPGRCGRIWTGRFEMSWLPIKILTTLDKISADGFEPRSRRGGGLAAPPTVGWEAGALAEMIIICHDHYDHHRRRRHYDHHRHHGALAGGSCRAPVDDSSAVFWTAADNIYDFNCYCRRRHPPPPPPPPPLLLVLIIIIFIIR